MFDGSRLDPDMDLESQRRADYGQHYQPDDDDPEAMFYEPPSASTPFRDNALSPETRPLARGSRSIAQTQPTWFDGQQRRRKDEEEEELEDMVVVGVRVGGWNGPLGWVWFWVWFWV